MSLLDLILAAILAGSIASGFMSGLARASVGFVASIAAIILGFWFYGVPAAWIEDILSAPPALANMGGFLTVFLGVTMAGSVLGGLIAKAFKWTGLSWLDKLMGAGFGFVRGGLMVIAFVAVLMAFTPRPAPNWMVGSVILPYAVEGSNVVATAAPKGLKDLVVDGLIQIREAWAEELGKARQRGIDTMRGDIP